MRSLSFPEANVKYGAPKNWNPAVDGHCDVLEVQRSEGSCLSLWTPDEGERAKIAQGHPIALQVVGEQPPVAVFVSPAHRVEGVDDEVDIFAAGVAAERKRFAEAVLTAATSLATDGAVTIDDLKAVLAVA